MSATAERRIQVFEKDGKFVKEGVRLEDDDRRRIGVGHRVLAATRSSSSSTSPTATTRRSAILERDTLDIVGSFGDGGRYPGQFFGVGSVAVDSKGNVYTGERSRESASRSSVQAKRDGDDRRRGRHADNAPRPGGTMRWKSPKLAPDRRCFVALAGRARRRSRRARQRAEAQAQGRGRWRRGSRSIRCGRSRCRITGSSGRSIGVGVDAKDHVWIVHRDNLLDAERSRREPESATGDVLRRRRRRCSSSIQPGNLLAPLGRAGRGLRVAGVEPRHHRSTTRATSGSAATAATDAHILKFTQDGKFLMQIGKPGQSKRQQRHRELRPAREDLRRREGQRGVRRRRLRQQARRRHRRRHRQVQALLGRLRQQAGRHQLRRATIPTRRPRSSSASRCTAPSCRTTAWSTSATAPTTASRCSSRTASS